MDLYKAYNQILTGEKLRSCYPNSLEEYKIETIFEKYNSSNFIKEVLFFDLGPKTLPWKDLRKYLNEFESRAHHTVSLFLFGILLFNELNLEIKNVPSYDADKFKNFIYFWSKICLYHDIGYIYEYKSKNDSCFLKNSFTLNDFTKNYNVEYNITDFTEDKELIKQYYHYRTEKCNCIDHGIVGGIILYDRALKYIDSHRKIYNSFENGLGYFGDSRKIGPNVEKQMEYIAMAIIKHNMYFSKKEDEITYKCRKLNKLIPLENNEHRYHLSNNVIFFLLCLVDSIEPVKTYEKEHINCDAQELCDLLKCIDINCDNNTIKLTINNAKFIKTYYQLIEGLELWLEIETETVCENTALLKII